MQDKYTAQLQSGAAPPKTEDKNFVTETLISLAKRKERKIHFVKSLIILVLVFVVALLGGALINILLTRLDIKLFDTLTGDEILDFYRSSCFSCSAKEAFKLLTKEYVLFEAPVIVALFFGVTMLCPALSALLIAVIGFFVGYITVFFTNTIFLGSARPEFVCVYIVHMIFAALVSCALVLMSSVSVSFFSILKMNVTTSSRARESDIQSFLYCFMIISSALFAIVILKNTVALFI